MKNYIKEIYGHKVLFVRIDYEVAFMFEAHGKIYSQAVRFKMKKGYGSYAEQEAFDTLERCAHETIEGIPALGIFPDKAELSTVEETPA